MEIALQFLQIIVGSGLVLAVYSNYSQIKLQNKLTLTAITENKFRSILIFMDIMLHPEHIKYTSESVNHDLESMNGQDDSVITEYYRNLIKANKENLYLYADDKIIRDLDNFLENPSEVNYITVAKRMNRNLWK